MFKNTDNNNKIVCAADLFCLMRFLCLEKNKWKTKRIKYGGMKNACVQCLWISKWTVFFCLAFQNFLRVGSCIKIRFDCRKFCVQRLKLETAFFRARPCKKLHWFCRRNEQRRAVQTNPLFIYAIKYFYDVWNAGCILETKLFLFLFICRIISVVNVSSLK